ncbi:hypothetical protein HC864_00315 [Candidatus Gracilibacteria bacterium]|nr:hypothetical protein [Candidatus Gracilibacteria bacterium]
MSEKTKLNKKANNFSISLLIIGLIIALAGVGYFAYDQYTKNESLQVQLSDPEAQANIEQEQATEIINKLKKILLVDESQGDPAVASVTDSEKLKEAQPEFYKDVQNGDYLVIYPSRAIIFRQAENKIINIAPIIRPPEGLQNSSDQSSDNQEEQTSQTTIEDSQSQNPQTNPVETNPTDSNLNQ